MVRVALRAVMLNEDDDAVVGSHGIRQGVQPADETFRIMRRISKRSLLHVDHDQGMFHLAAHLFRAILQSS
jgi:hypothetical protein